MENMVYDIQYHDHIPKLFKNYNLTPVEQIELDRFLKENHEKGYIQPSQSHVLHSVFL